MINISDLFFLPEKEIQNSLGKTYMRVQTFFCMTAKHLDLKLPKGRGMFTTVILSRNYRRKSSPILWWWCHFDESFLLLRSIYCDICTGGDHL